MKKEERARIERRIEAAAYERIPGGFQNLLAVFHEGGSWWVWVYDKCVVWSVRSTDFRDPKASLHFKRLPPKEQEEGFQRYLRTLRTPYKERRTVRHQIEVAAYGQIRGAAAMAFTAFYEGGEWVLYERESGAAWDVRRVTNPGSRSGFRFRKVSEEDQ